MSGLFLLLIICYRIHKIGRINFYICFMLKYISLLCFLLLLISCKGGRDNAPALAKEDVSELNSETAPNLNSLIQSVDSLKSYVPISEINPNYIMADLSGDGVLDYAVLTKSETDSKVYIIIFHSEEELLRIGGGDGMEDGNLTLEWVTGIEVFTDRDTFQSIFDKETGDILGTANITLKRDAIGLKYGDSGTIGILYWDGTNYTYIHQFD